MNRQEDALIRKIDRELKRRPSTPVEQLWEQFQKEVFENQAYTVSEQEFIPIYGRDAVQRDLHEVEKRQREFLRNQTPIQEKLAKVSAVLEGLIGIHTELSNWLGPEAKTLNAAKFDDIFHGVDAYVEWGNRRHTVALGVDATFSKLDEAVMKKLERIKERMKRGELTKIRYYRSTCGDFMGERKNVPLALLVHDQETVHQLATLHLARNYRALATHPVQLDILQQLAYQMDVMADFFKNQPSASGHIIDRVSRAALNTATIFAEKKNAFPAPYRPSEATVRLMRCVDQVFSH